MQHNVTVDGINISYSQVGGIGAEETVLFIPPGGNSSLFVKDFFNSVPDGVRIIAPDYPCMGDSQSISNNSVYEIAKIFNSLSRELNIFNATVMGVSFGGAVVNEMLSLDKSRYKKVILLATGEFFGPTLRVVFDVVFFLPKYSEIIRKFYRFIIIDIFRVFSPMEFRDTKSQFEQWKSIYKYKLSLEKIEIPTMIIFCAEDIFVSKDSPRKLANKYPNHRLLNINVRHTSKFTENEKEEINFFTSKFIYPFVFLD